MNLNKMFHKLSREFEVSPDVIEKCYYEHLKYIKKRLDNPDFIKMELLGFGIIHINKTRFNRQIRSYIYQIRRTRERIEKYKNNYALEELYKTTENLRKLWQFKQEILKYEKKVGSEGIFAISHRGFKKLKKRD